MATAFAMNLVGYGGTFVAFTFLAPILEQVTGLPAGRVSGVLFLYGVSVIAGSALGGRLTNRKPVPVLIAMFALQALALLLFTITASLPWAAMLTLALLGGLSFCNVPGLHLYVVQLAHRYRPEGVDVASAMNIAAANLGIALAAFIGGRVVASPLGLRATPCVGACMVGIALLLTVGSGWADRRRSVAATARHDEQV